MLQSIAMEEIIKNLNSYVVQGKVNRPFDQIGGALLYIEHVQVKAETLVLDGDPKEMICHSVEQVHADLLVVGSRGLGKIKR